MSKTVLLVLLVIPVLTIAACGQAERTRVPSEVNEVITNIGEQLDELYRTLSTHPMVRYVL